MNARILDGRKVSDRLLTDIKQQVAAIKADGGRVPGLAAILVGDDPASSIYVNKKIQACEKIGFKSQQILLKNNVSQQQLLQQIELLNSNPDIHGILVQLPLPQHIDSTAVLEAILPHKDVDCFHPYNIGRLVQRIPKLRPCTPYGILLLLREYAIQTKGLHAVVVGASNIVGRPMAMELLLDGATVTICHRFTENLAEHVANADLLIAAVGKPSLIKGEWIKPGAVVVDVGINRMSNGELAGDVEFTQAAQKASWITPVPGGVGPMTVATLMLNTLTAAKNR